MQIDVEACRHAQTLSEQNERKESFDCRFKRRCGPGGRENMSIRNNRSKNSTFRHKTTLPIEQSTHLCFHREIIGNFVKLAFFFFIVPPAMALTISAKWGRSGGTSHQHNWKWEFRNWIFRVEPFGGRSAQRRWKIHFTDGDPRMT